MELFRYVGIVIGGIFGVIFTIGSICSITYDPARPDYVSGALLLVAGLLLLVVAYICWKVEFPKDN